MSFQPARQILEDHGAIEIVVRFVKAAHILDPGFVGNRNRIEKGTAAADGHEAVGDTVVEQ